MIHFLITADHHYTLDKFFEHWGARLRPQIRVVHYESRPWRRVAPAGAWVFTDLERLAPHELAEARDFFQRLSADRSRWRLLNNPAAVLRRHDLLNRLAERGINGFRAYRVNALPDSLRFPAFLRGENDHRGSLSSLLQDRAALEKSLGQLRGGRDNKHLVVVEYCPYAREDGLFVKYSAMRIGPALIPRHMLFSRKWEVKYPDYIDEACLAEEEAYLAHMPHGQELLELFELAGIDYGRIDYTLVQDRIQVFEINTNPNLVPPVSKLDPCRWPSQARSAALVLQAIESLNAGLPEPGAEEARVMQRADRLQAFVYPLRRRFCRRRP